ncbi:MAG: transcription elongation factor GreA [Hyphomonadaceae bacterium]
MSRAFVKEEDGDRADDLPDRVLSPHPNLVTAAGLDAIDAELARLHDEGPGEDAAAKAHHARDMRYWSARRASAQVMPPPQDANQVRFGSTVTVLRQDGRRQSFRIVGEDEADPEHGTLSYASPLARAVMGKAEGDVAMLNAEEVEIEAIA